MNVSTCEILKVITKDLTNRLDISKAKGSLFFLNLMTDHIVTAEQWSAAADKLMFKYGRNGSGRASALRLVGVYFIYRQGGYAALRHYGFSRHSIMLYLEKLTDAGLLAA